MLYLLGSHPFDFGWFSLFYSVCLSCVGCLVRAGKVLEAFLTERKCRGEISCVLGLVGNKVRFLPVFGMVCLFSDIHVKG